MESVAESLDIERRVVTVIVPNTRNGTRAIRCHLPIPADVELPHVGQILHVNCAIASINFVPPRRKFSFADNPSEKPLDTRKPIYLAASCGLVIGILVGMVIMAYCMGCIYFLIPR